MGTTPTFLLAVILAEVAVPTFLLARKLPRRSHHALRIVATILVLGMLSVLGDGRLGLLFSIPTGPGVGSDPRGFFFFPEIMVLFFLAVMFIYDTPIWPALFCCTAGYTMQNLESGLSVLVRAILPPGTIPDGPLTLALPMCVVVYVSCYFAFIKRTEAKGLSSIADKGMLTMFVVVVLGVIWFDIIIKGLVVGGIPMVTQIALRILHASVCIFTLYSEYEMLYNRQLQAEVAMTGAMLEDEKRQYELSRENIDVINQKCHEIRKQIRKLGETNSSLDPVVLDDIAREVRIYDSKVKTGNDALDLILTEKRLTCEQEDITLSCIVDGRALSFMAPTDLYSLFGNALDNAMAAVRGIDDPERRSISIVVRQHEQIVTIHTENYFASGRAEKGKRTCDRSHSTETMKLVVERYGGSMTTKTTGSVYLMSALIPVPEG